ncbi:MAG: HPF/RaiA family ribosome-associated protein [Gemmatimonadales bacterium]|nr:MAG: HPF/RaiA family ribosome-associated protein [Gemmatimonadales bacterium]
MQVPPEIAFRGLEPTDSLKVLILEGIEKLEKVYPNLISCRTVVTDDTPSRHSGHTYRVRLEVGIPKHNVIVDKRDPESIEHKDVTQAIREAFSIARKRLLEIKERQSGDVKTHDLPPHGRITRLLIDDTGVRYGFLESREGRQVYFHEEALVDLDYDDLEVGDEVRYAAAEGDEGPQASTLARLDPHRIGPVQERSIPLKEEPRN